MKVWSRFKRLVTVFLAFWGGQLGWVVLAAVVASAVEQAGYSVPDSTVITLAPLGGVLAVAYVLGVFD